MLLLPRFVFILKGSLMILWKRIRMKGRHTLRLLVLWLDYRRRDIILHDMTGGTFRGYLRAAREQMRERRIDTLHMVAVQSEPIAVYNWLTARFHSPIKESCGTCGVHTDFQWTTYRCRMPNGRLSRLQYVLSKCRKCGAQKQDRMMWRYNTFVEPNGHRSLDERLAARKGLIKQI